MSETIKQALTPEEWARWFAIEADNDLIDEESSHSPLSQAYNAAEIGNEHAVAAIMLLGQPFGFTREDVAVLREIVEVSQFPFEARTCASLADRIEALLPPGGP